MNILFLAYRDWAKQIFSLLLSNPRINSIRLVDSEVELLNLNIAEFDVLFTAGWSEELPESVTESVLCIGLHCAELDRYSYGTPLQLQIMDGIEFTKHRIFKFDAKGQSQRAHTHNRLYSHEVTLDLSGGIDQVFYQLTATGVTLFNLFIKDFPNINWITWPEETTKKTKRTPNQSELKKEMLSSLTTLELYNFIRSLEDPYPNAYIEDAVGILYIKKATFRQK